MAIQLECNYSKKLGLPGYSSHQFSITVRTEISDVNQVQQESARLYKLLQTGVDASIQETGFLPANNGAGNGHNNGDGGANSQRQNGNGNGQGNGNAENGAWNCSRKQQDLIQRIVTENKLDKNEIESLAQDRFGKGVKTLNKLEASGLIEELLVKTGQSVGNGRSRFQRVGGR